MTDTTTHVTPDRAVPRRLQEGFWMRLLYAVVLLLVFALAETVLWVLTAIQLLWQLLMKERNAGVAEFGAQLADWTRDAVAYLTGAREEKPFPWSETAARARDEAAKGQ
jgi:hypothetical protein